MRYAHGGGLTPKEQEKRERVRLEAAERFACAEKSEAVVRQLRVTSRSVRRWRWVWEEGRCGRPALEGAGLGGAAELPAMRGFQPEVAGRGAGVGRGWGARAARVR